MSKTFAFIFDLDGTLIDSTHQIFQAVNQTCVKLKIQTPNFEEVKKNIGLSAEKLFESTRLEEQNFAEAVILFRKFLAVEIEQENKTFPGVVDFLKLSYAKKIQLGVATSKPHVLALAVVQNSELQPFISETQGVDGFPPKPDPTVINRCLQKLNSDSGVMFGDRVEDIKAANKAGIASIGITQGPHTKQELIDAGAQRVYSSFLELESNSSEVFAILKGINE